MRSLFMAVSLAGSLLLAARWVGAGPPAPPVAPAKVTLNLEDVSLRRALADLFRQVDARYALEPDVPNVAVSLRVTGVTFHEALRALTRVANVAYGRRDGVFVIMRVSSSRCPRRSDGCR